jgi:hypothetical protein
VNGLQVKAKPDLPGLRHQRAEQLGGELLQVRGKIDLREIAGAIKCPRPNTLPFPFSPDRCY